MNRQPKESKKAMLSTIASLFLSVKNTFIEYQTRLFPFARAFLVLCLSGNTVRLLLIVTACLAIEGCSTALITTGVLDRPAQERMFSAADRAGLEALAKKPIASSTNADGNIVDVYIYVDGEAGVIGRRGRPMSGERVGRAFATVLTSGFFEVLMVPVALHERSEATRQFYVVYAPDNLILAICWPSYPVDVPGRELSLCNSEPKP